MKEQIAIQEVIEQVYRILDDKQAENIKVINISEISSLADYFIITNGKNSTHSQSLADYVEERLTAIGYRLHRLEGAKNGQWLLLDYGFLVIHIFDRDQRAYYQLEEIWADGKEVTNYA